MKAKIIKTLQNGDELQMICVTDFSIANAAVIKKTLLLSAARTGNELLSLSKATSIDITGIQLAFAWQETLKLQNRIGRVLLPDTESIKDLLNKVGIEQMF